MTTVLQKKNGKRWTACGSKSIRNRITSSFYSPIPGYLDQLSKAIREFEEIMAR